MNMAKKEIYMQNGLTNITRGVVCLMAIAVVCVCAILLPELAREEKVENPNAGPAYPFFIGAWMLSIPIFVALYQTLKLTNYIDANIAFSELSVKAIQSIKTCAIAFGALIVIGATIVIVIGKSIDPSEDLAPIATFGFIFTFVSSVVATFAATLERLLKDALKMKEENELTV